MKALRATVLLMFCVLAWPAARARAADRLEITDIGGLRYVRLSDWARLNNFEGRWIKRDEVLQLSNRTSRLVFMKDSRTAEVNGLNVALSHPAVMRNGLSYLAVVDFNGTILPLLVPPKYPAGSRVRTIVIDPGHGGRDPGFEVGSYQEKKYTLLLALELRDQLKQAGYNVSLTRTSDAYIDPFSRPDIANQRKADLFISLHWNAVSDGKSEVRGAQTYCLTPAGTASSNDSREQGAGTGAKPGNRNNDRNLFLAYELQQSLVRNLGVEDRGVKKARYAVLCDAQMPAVLIEGGYMSHPGESRKIFDPAYRQQMARAIVEGVAAYRRQLEPAEPRAALTQNSNSGGR